MCFSHILWDHFSKKTARKGMYLADSTLYPTRTLLDVPFLSAHIWRRVLSCFPLYRALSVDLKFGCVETNWMMEERMLEIPSSSTWLVAAHEHSVGLLVRLMTFQVPCVNMDDIIQYAADMNHIDTLVMFTYNRETFTFRNMDGERIKDSKFVPKLDQAALLKYHDILRYCMWKYAPHKERFFKQPSHTVSRLITHNHLQTVKMLVPRVLSIPNIQPILKICESGYVRMFEYCLPHITPLLKEPILDDLCILAARNNRRGILKRLKTYLKTPVPLKAFQVAFSMGNLAICEDILRQSPSYRPKKADIIDACRQGYLSSIELLCSLDKSYSLPAECMERAVESKNVHLIRFLDQHMPSYEYKIGLLHDAIRTKDSHVCITVFDLGRYKQLPRHHDIELVHNNMQYALSIFHKIGFRVYTENGFIEACRLCHVGIIRDILDLPEEERPYIKESSWTTALCAIQVSSEGNNQTRIEAYDYVTKKYNEFKSTNKSKRPNVVIPTLVTSTNPKHKKPKIVLSKLPKKSHQDRSAQNHARVTKRQKHI